MFAFHQSIHSLKVQTRVLIFNFLTSLVLYIAFLQTRIRLLSCSNQQSILVNMRKHSQIVKIGPPYFCFRKSRVITVKLLKMDLFSLILQRRGLSKTIETVFLLEQSDRRSALFAQTDLFVLFDCLGKYKRERSVAGSVKH